MVSRFLTRVPKLSNDEGIALSTNGARIWAYPQTKKIKLNSYIICYIKIKLKIDRSKT